MADKALTMGTVLLVKWMLDHKKTQLELEAASGVPQHALSRYVRGDSKPSVEYAVLLERVTGGVVAVASWNEVVTRVRTIERHLAAVDDFRRNSMSRSWEANRAAPRRSARPRRPAAPRAAREKLA